MTGRNIETAFPLTPLQEGMLYHSIRHPDSAAYRGQCAVELHGPLDDVLFREVWDGIATRHQAFRTFFAWEGRDRPLQVVREHVSLPWDILDWAEKTEDDAERAWTALLAEDRARPVDLTVAPVMRFALVHLGPERHRVLWSVHHMLADGWSSRLVMSEVLASYEARRSGRPPTRDAPPSFATFVTWLSSRDAKAAERHWRAQLSGLRASTALPGASTGPPGEARSTVEHVLVAGASEAIEAAAARMRVTPNTMALGAWALVLSRYLEATEDITFGVTVSERPPRIPGVERSVGLYLNTIPVRTRVTHGMGISDWLSGLQRTFADAREHSAGGLADIHPWSEVPAGTPLVRSVVVYESFPAALEYQAPDASLQLMWTDVRAPSDLPLALLLHPGEAFRLQLEYDTSLYTPEAASRLLRIAAQALQGLAAEDARTLDDVDLLDAELRHTLLDVWSGAETPPPAARDVLELFEEQARLAPDAPAVRDADSVTTYGALDDAANRLAHRIRRDVPDPEALLGIPAERRAATIIAVLAALKAGRGYTMLDPLQPRRRLEALLARVDRVLAATEDDRWGDRRLASDSLADETSLQPDVTPDPGGVAYVVWTSGSTGEPKGVVVERGQLAASTGARIGCYGNEPEVNLLLSSLAVDSSVAGLYGTLCSGGCLILPPHRIEQDPAALVALVEDASVETTLLLPSLHRALLEEADTRKLRSLRRVIVAGEACARSVVDLHRSRLSSVELYNEYGPSEATVWATLADLTTDASGDVSIGRPVPGVRVYLLDPDGRPVPPGAPGEICIGGGTVARGYLDDPVTTAERFLDDPFSPGGRMYRTGDRGRFLSDGRIEFLGRIDDQIKVRGHRVEPAEVERALEAHPGVAEAAVALDGDDPRRLLAYFTPVSDPPSADALTAFVADRVPAPMVPAAFVVLDRLPRTSAGKLDRRGLAEVSGTVLSAGRPNGRAPATPLERALADIWKGVLGIDDVDVDADFFALGGDSLLSIRVLSRASRAGISISPEDFFAGPTISRLAALGEGSSNADQGVVTGRFALTPIQSWFFETITHGRDHWNQSFLFDAPDDMDADAFRRVVGMLVSHHDALRLRFPREGNEWRQELGPEPDRPPVRVVDLAGLNERQREVRIEREADTEHRSFDLSTGDLFRTILFVGESGVRRVLLLAHHLVVDAVSWGILLEDLSTLVEQAARGSALSLPPKTSSVADWSAALLDAAKDPGLVDAADHWLRISDSTPAQNAPDEARAGASNLVADAATVTVDLDENGTRVLTGDVTRRLGATIEEVLLGALVSVWADQTGRSRIRVDVEGHGRDAVKGLDASRTVGWFTTASQLVLDVPGTGVAEVVATVRRTIADLPGGRATWGLLHHLCPDVGVRDAMHALPRSELIFNYLSTVEDVLPAGSAFAWTGESVGCARSMAAPRAYRLEVNALIRAGRLTVNVEYSAAEYRSEQMEYLAGALRSALRALMDDAAPTKPTFELAGLDEADLSRVADLLAEIDGA